jgi:NAD(P)-dependent dehydrogenase (short-subunit alcohol dehydrogenase family)
MTSLQDKVIAVTGAGSGIGRALALGLAARGAKLALCDCDADGLAETSRQLGNSHAHSAVFDVTEAGALERFAAETKAAFGRIDGVINNAGLTVVAPFEHLPRADFARVMAVNFDAVVEGTRVFLPYVQASGAGWIVNISSVFGLMPYPTQTAYCASKFAVRGFTETLRTEQQMQGSNVQVVCVHPGGIKTSVARNAKFIRGMAAEDDSLLASDRFEQAAKTTAAKAADTILRGMERGKVRVRIGADARIIDWIMRLLPARGFGLLGRLMG